MTETALQTPSPPLVGVALTDLLAAFGEDAWLHKCFTTPTRSHTTETVGNQIDGTIELIEIEAMTQRRKTDEYK